MPRDRATDDAQDLFTRGHRALDAGDFQEAVECFSRAIRLRPNVSDVYRARAHAYLEMGDRVRALNPAQKAILRFVLDSETFAPDPELKAKLTRRWEDYQSGKVQAIPLDDYLAELDRRIAERKGQ